MRLEFLNLEMSSELVQIKNLLTSNDIKLPDGWLESCIHFCKSEYLPPKYTLLELQNEVYKQWLVYDFRETKFPLLPPNLSSQQLYTLNGTFCLQMMKIMDISKPKLWQLQKIRNSNALTRDAQQESEIVGTGKRLLQMTLSDGVQEVEAMEYKPITCLSLNLPPGKKIKIVGPVVVRRGRLMLEEQNVRPMGGNLDILTVPNAAENVLARWLKLPENPEPKIIEEKALIVEKEEKNEGFVSNAKIQRPQPKSKPAPPSPKLELSAEEEMMMAQDFDELLDTEQELIQSRPPDPLSTSLDDDNDDLFCNIDIDAHLDDVDKQEEKNVPEPNIITIENLKQKKNIVSKGIFRIKAKFKSVEEKLTMADGEFRLVIKVEDSSADLVARVHSDVIADFAECSAEEIMNLKSDVLGKNEEAVKKMMGAILKVKEKLLQLDNVFVLQIEKDQLALIKKII